MQERLAEVLVTYTKRNASFMYQQAHSDILMRILEVVYSTTESFWLFSMLIE